MRPLGWMLGLVLVFAMARGAQAQDLTGTWHGHWQDCKSGHSGPMRAVFCQCDESRYKVVFTGRYFKVIPFRFATVLNVTGREGDKTLLAGQSNLGLFGVFHYSAEATATDFTAQFSSRRYDGRFVLSR